MAEQRNDIWILGAIAATESGSAQGQADVAQSIYNRVASDRFPNTIYEVVTTDNQYQPAFVNPGASSGAGAKVAPEWKAVKDEATAIEAMRSYYRKRNQPITESQARQKLNSSISAIQNTTLQQNAATWVGSRTGFRSSGTTDYGDKWRGSGSDNRFGHDGLPATTAASAPSACVAPYRGDAARGGFPRRGAARPTRRRAACPTPRGAPACARGRRGAPAR